MQTNAGTTVGGEKYLNYNCWLVKNLNYAPYRRCQYCKYRFRNCLFLQYQIVSVALAVIILPLFLLFEGKISALAIISVFASITVFGYFFNKSTEKIIKAQFAQEQASQKLKELSDMLEVKVNEQTQDIIAKNARLEKLLQVRSEFLDVASHQLRTPVSMIRGVLSMIRDGDLEHLPRDKQAQFIENAWQKGAKLDIIINDILAASEFDTQTFMVDSKTPTIFLEDVVDQVVKGFQLEAERRSIELVWHPPKKHFPKVKGRVNFLEQAISNLISNAFKYTPSTNMVKEARSRRDKKGVVGVTINQVKNNIVVGVSDNGIGIPKEEIKKLFEKFVRASNATAMYTDGSGLGLFIVREIVEGHHGNVWVESELNKGSTFFFSIPVVSN
ncbi:MAG: HAMP domain-containing sensor histidine kinase [Patescibacteria group bacterium]|nr:HAMP domain-containing sensor histidine kinase [Patescibacteria group bacterium]MDD5715918.1 HAMP domain-containing sensor histidine kinase [Patescibacteria group bacterium]